MAQITNLPTNPTPEPLIRINNNLLPLRAAMRWLFQNHGPAAIAEAKSVDAGRGIWEIDKIRYEDGIE